MTREVERLEKVYGESRLRHARTRPVYTEKRTWMTSPS